MPVFNDFERLLNWSNYLYIAGGVLTLCMTLAIVHFGNKVSAIKAAQLKAYQTAADERIAEAHRTAEVAQATAEQSRLDKEKVLHQNLLLQSQIESEKMARLRIEERIAPRHLTQAAQGDLISDLKLVQRGQLDVVLFGGNAEATNLAGEIAHAFQICGWSIGSEYPNGVSMAGIQIRFVPNDSTAAQTAELVRKALGASGIVSEVLPGIDALGQRTSTQSDLFGKGKVRLYVGSK